MGYEICCLYLLSPLKPLQCKEKIKKWKRDLKKKYQLFSLLLLLPVKSKYLEIELEKASTVTLQLVSVVVVNSYICSTNILRASFSLS